MTNRAKIVVWAIVSCVVGVIAGGIIAANYTLSALSKFHWEMNTDVVQVMSVTEVNRDVVLLYLLRKGDTQKAIDRLEMSLDGHVLGLGFSPRPSGKTPDRVAEAKARAKKYRNDFPHKAVSTEIDNMVKAVLSQQPQ